ncbi:MAG: bifunctional riboflavin kinase/FAD synthetase [Candidatus Eisenbacteria bacterium]|nr:bifunctional riboflavin kinase/FAD synthetase [Candidatus Eisenbacteria bacterium]
MKVWRSIEDVEGAVDRVAVAVGVFDGIHMGHRAIVARAVEHARERKGIAVVLTFDPHPRCVLRGCRPPRILTTLDEKLGILAHLGVDGVLVLPFDHRLASLTAEEFVRTAFTGPLHAEWVVVGYDFRLGRGREGDGKTLRELGRRHGFDTELIEASLWEGRPVKSTWIRDEIEIGSVARAAELLRRYHSLSGVVESGEGRGRGLGWPTANLRVLEEGKLWPALGVYAGLVEIEEGLLPAAVNVGVRPTFGEGAEPNVEAHIIGAERDLRGRAAKVHFLARIRGERTFPSARDLADQIGRDARMAKERIRAGKENFIFTGRAGSGTFLRNGESTCGRGKSVIP